MGVLEYPRGYDRKGAHDRSRTGTKPRRTRPASSARSACRTRAWAGCTGPGTSSRAPSSGTRRWRPAVAPSGPLTAASGRQSRSPRSRCNWARSTPCRCGCTCTAIRVRFAVKLDFSTSQHVVVNVERELVSASGSDLVSAIWDATSLYPNANLAAALYLDVEIDNGLTRALITGP